VAARQHPVLLRRPPYGAVAAADLPAGSRWVFDHPFYLLLNVAIGGPWAGSPDASTTFPQPLRVDYVRVYQ
jgi:beta-glucanase (GH16 family)